MAIKTLEYIKCKSKCKLVFLLLIIILNYGIIKIEVEYEK